MNSKIVCSILFLFIFTSCASKTQSRSMENYYSPTGVDQYFLNDLPKWANFDDRAGCYRESNIRYFDLNALMKSYKLNYNQSLQVQASFNEEFLKIGKNSKAPMLKEEELLFYKVNEKVASKIIFFDPPVFDRIHLIFLDEVLGDPKKEKKLKDFLNSSVNDSGVPILVSLCLTRDEIEKKYPDFNTKMITAELFSVYDGEGNATPGFKFDLSKFFKADQKIYLYSQKNSVPAVAFRGTFKILNY